MGGQPAPGPVPGPRPAPREAPSSALLTTAALLFAAGGLISKLAPPSSPWQQQRCQATAAPAGGSRSCLLCRARSLPSSLVPTPLRPCRCSVAGPGPPRAEPGWPRVRRLQQLRTFLTFRGHVHRLALSQAWETFSERPKCGRSAPPALSWPPGAAPSPTGPPWTRSSWEQTPHLPKMQHTDQGPEPGCGREGWEHSEQPCPHPRG